MDEFLTEPILTECQFKELKKMVLDYIEEIKASGVDLKDTACPLCGCPVLAKTSMKEEETE